MKNPLDFFSKKNQDEETYLGLFLKENDGILFYISHTSEGNLRITKKEKFSYTDGWERLAEDVDQVLNRLETITGKSPEKTIFFIYSHLVDPVTREIKRPYLQKIKQLVKNLELKPLGFIECHEAILDYLQQKEKIPLTANLIEFDKTNLGIFVYTTGRLIFSETITREGNVVNDLLPVFERIKTQTVIPPRIILYDSKDLDVESTSILTHQWGKDFFIQLPKVQIFKEDQVIESFLNIFSSQMREEGSISAEMGEKKAEFEKSEVMGFMIGDDVRERTDVVPPHKEQSAKTTILKRSGSAQGFAPLIAASNLLEQIRKKIERLYSKTKALPFPLLPTVGIALIAISILSMEYFFHTATVRVILPSQDISKDIEIKASLAKEARGDTLALKVATESADVDQSTATTGKRSIGDKAKGTVTILNYDSNQTTFNQETIIQAQGFKFILGGDVTVASASVAPDLSLQPGKSNTSVIADAIGPESNLGKDQKFQIGDFPQNRYLATNSNAFSGGSKRDVQTVAEEDVAGLKEKILVQVKDFSNKQLKSKIDKNDALVPQLLSFDLGDIDYSVDVGDEASTIEGKTKAEITYFAYKQKDLQTMVNKLLSPEIRPGFHINQEASSYKIREIGEQGNDYVMSVAAQVKSVEDIKIDDLSSKIKGKSSNGLQTLVRDEYHAQGVEIQVKHPVPWIRNWLPFFKKNINLGVSYL